MSNQDKVNYIDKEDFTKRVSEYIYKYREAKEQGKFLPIPDDIAKDLMMLVKHIASSRNYANYTWRDLMESQALEICVRYFHNFNPDKYDNAFGYFSLIIYRAFNKVIKEEKERHRRMMEYVVDEGYSRLAAMQSEYGTDANTEFFDQLLADEYGYVPQDQKEEAEEQQEPSKKKRTPIEKLMDEQ